MGCSAVFQNWRREESLKSHLSGMFNKPISSYQICLGFISITRGGCYMSDNNWREFFVRVSSLVGHSHIAIGSYSIKTRIDLCKIELTQSDNMANNDPNGFKSHGGQ